MNAQTIEAALRALGATPDAVAASLRARGCKGVPQKACDCPLSRFVARLDPEIQWVSAAPRYFSVLFAGQGWPLAVDTPDNCNEFMRAFDKRLYPDLIAEDQ